MAANSTGRDWDFQPHPATGHSTWMGDDMMVKFEGSLLTGSTTGITAEGVLKIGDAVCHK